jgi:hypothetical protein
MCYLRCPSPFERPYSALLAPFPMGFEYTLKRIIMFHTK